MKTNSQPVSRSAAAVALSALFLAACSGGKEQGSAPGAGGPPPVIVISVDPMTPRASDSAVAWLRDNDFQIDESAAERLEPYLATG